MSNKPERLKEPDEFARELVASLDESLEGLDELTVQRLKASRIRALEHTRIGRLGNRIAIGAAAAVIAAALLAPALWYQQRLNATDVDEIAALEIPPSAQELDDLDMLIALEDEDA